jgi:pimeloyl-ACP methyl ester carboxylesterase
MGLVEAGYQIIMHDRRGYGQSDPGPDFDEFYVSDQFCPDSATDLDALLAHLGIDSFHIVGQCEGGVIGVEYAITHPDRVQSLVIASTLCFSATTMTEFNRVKFPLSFDELAPDLRKKLILWHGQARALPLYDMCRTHGGAYGVGPFDLRPKLPGVVCPTLVLYPDRSSLFEVEQGVAMYRNLPHAELSVIPRCGHNSYDQRPDEYREQVLRFLNRVAAAKNGKREDFSMTCLAPAPPQTRTL